MSRETRRSRGRVAARQRRAWIVAGLSVAALVLVTLTFGRRDGHGHHPQPRVASEQPPVVPSTQFAQYPRVAESYQMAAAVPMILDGIYCHCHCEEHSGHHSLLDCFASEHAARCDVCMSEAVIAYRMSMDGASMEAIRAEVDRIYGT